VTDPSIVNQKKQICPRMPVYTSEEMAKIVTFESAGKDWKQKQIRSAKS